MQEPNEQKPAVEQDTQIDPMEFLEETAESSAQEHPLEGTPIDGGLADGRGGIVYPKDAPAQADEAFGPVSVGDPESPHALTGQPTAQDLDIAAEEQAVAEHTAAQPVERLFTDEECLPEYFEDPPAKPVPAPAPVAPAPRRPGCGHGFSNARLCPTCRASGV